MCGIAGGLFWGADASRDDAAAVVRSMTRALAHRGPDGEGVWVHDALAAGGPVVAFGHRRLAIIDPSAAGAQPMAAGPSVITYNGEVFNFATLRGELEVAGELCRSRSDTEVVLRSYLVWGRRVFDRLRGMFALGVWDAAHGRLTLARDRFGIKPLYYAEGPDFFLFASELRALLASGRIARRLDRIALQQFLGYQSVPPPRTLIAGVRQLPPGHYLDIAHGTPAAPRRYWDLLAAARPRHGSARQCREQVRELLDDAVRSHLVSDVPVGLFLSGGIDSAAIAMLMAAQGVQPQSFSVAMTEAAFDERSHARAVAAASGADHREIELSIDEVRDAVPAALARMDHPSGDGINTFVISEAVRQHGYKVALSGLGGDELFGGYPSFRRIPGARRWLERWGHAPRPLRRVAARVVGSLEGFSPAVGKTSAVIETDGSLARVWPITRQVFTEHHRAQLLASGDEAGDPYVDLLTQAFDESPGADLMAKISYAESRTYMHDVLLADTDQMSMAHGLEVRVPLLDHPLAEYVVGLPEYRKQQPGGTPKPLLVDALEGLLPSSIVNRPKHGFTLPFPVWMRGPLRGFCEARLGPDGLGGRAEFCSKAVRAVWKDFLASRTGGRWTRVWLLVALATWLERQDIEA
jgi:asparagine synthase (glutamine-hydrolysing)